MPWDRLLARSQRSAVRVSVAVLALALGLTLAGSQATASTSTLAVSPSTVGNGANLTFGYSTPASYGQFDQLDRHLRARAGPRPGGVYNLRVPPPTGLGDRNHLDDQPQRRRAVPGVLPLQRRVPAIGRPDRLHGGRGAAGAAPGIRPTFLARSVKERWTTRSAVAVDARATSGWPTRAITGSKNWRRTACPIDVLGSGSLDQPQGIALDPEGDVWVSDTGNNRLVEFSSSGKVLSTIGGPGAGDGQFDNPTALTVSAKAERTVADQDNNRVEELSSSGTYLASISVPTPDGVALGSAGNIWVSSPSYAAGNALYEFSPTGTQITTLRLHPGQLRGNVQYLRHICHPFGPDPGGAAGLRLGNGVQP